VTILVVAGAEVLLGTWVAVAAEGETVGRIGLLGARVSVAAGVGVLIPPLNVPLQAVIARRIRIAETMWNFIRSPDLEDMPPILEHPCHVVVIYRLRFRNKL